jgi:hypothetical protein
VRANLIKAKTGTLAEFRRLRDGRVPEAMTPDVEADRNRGKRRDGRLESTSLERVRNHQGLENELIGRASARDHVGRIRSRPRLGGLLNDYARAA